MMRVLGLLLCGVLLAASIAPEAYGDSLQREVGKAFNKIGVGPEQMDAYAEIYEEFLRSRNSQMRRVLKNRSGEEVSVMARKKARRAAKKSVRKMAAVLSELQLKYYEEYLEVANKLFLREAGLR